MENLELLENRLEDSLEVAFVDLLKTDQSRLLLAGFEHLRWLDDCKEKDQNFDSFERRPDEEVAVFQVFEPKV